jgi:hypothetical protein
MTPEELHFVITKNFPRNMLACGYHFQNLFPQLERAVKNPTNEQCGIYATTVNTRKNASNSEEQLYSMLEKELMPYGIVPREDSRLVYWFCGGSAMGLEEVIGILRLTDYLFKVGYKAWKNMHICAETRLTGIVLEKNCGWQEAFDTLINENWFKSMIKQFETSDV